MTWTFSLPASAPNEDAPADDVLGGLLATRKHLPCRLLYDARGAQLFERICTVDDYYPTRSELALLQLHLPAIADAIGSAARVIEPGSGEGIKTRMLLAALDRPAAYVPIDVSGKQLEQTARTLGSAFPDLEIQPVCADYTSVLELPRSARPSARTVVFFPGSTIGNFEPDAARTFLSAMGELAGAGGMLLLGADSNSDVAALLRAYDDSEGVTAQFNLNILTHINRTHGAKFDLDAFEHRAVWNAARSRVEMHLISRWRQTVRVHGVPIQLARGESIVTEHCYKHSPAAVTTLLADSGWRLEAVMHDDLARMHLWLAARA